MADPPWAPMLYSLTSPILLTAREGGGQNVWTICLFKTSAPFDSVT